MYRQALIMAGGQGTRLRRLGQVLPKCMVPIYDQPLLLTQIAQLAKAGITEIFISIPIKYEGFFDEFLKQYSPPNNIKISCLPESTPLGATGGLAAVLPVLRGPSLIVLGDEFYEDHKPFEVVKGMTNPPDLILGAVKTTNKTKVHCSIIVDSSERITSIREKPAPADIISPWRWCGFVALTEKGLKRAIDVSKTLEPKSHIGDLLNQMLGPQISSGILQFQEFHLNINTVDQALLATLIDAQRNWQRERPKDFAALEQAVKMLFKTLDI